MELPEKIRERAHTYTPDVRDRLRGSTAALHARVDQAFGRLLRDGQDGYPRFLAASAAAVIPLERALTAAHVVDLLPDWPQRCRSQAVRSDLCALSLAAPRMVEVRLDRDEAFLFGVLYVLEGSRLGARVLQRALAERLAPHHRQAMSYLEHGDGRPLWPSFVARLNASSEARAEPERTIAGATMAFEKFLLAAECTRSVTFMAHDGALEAASPASLDR